MTVPTSIAAAESILDTMIQLAHAAKSHRVVAAGTAAFDLYRGLCHRGFSRVSTIASCQVKCLQCDVALIAGEETLQVLEKLLVRIVSILNTEATIAVWVDSVECQRGRRIQQLLERLGFRIESGAKCATGFVLAARRREPSYLANVA
jgi:hypothetical protein